jgi:hypothetical protein
LGVGGHYQFFESLERLGAVCPALLVIGYLVEVSLENPVVQGVGADTGSRPYFAPRLESIGDLDVLLVDHRPTEEEREAKYRPQQRDDHHELD